MQPQLGNTDIFGYNDTSYSDTPLTVTVLFNNTLLQKSVTVSKYLLTATLFPSPEGVTVTEDVCKNGRLGEPRQSDIHATYPQNLRDR